MPLAKRKHTDPRLVTPFHSTGVEPSFFTSPSICDILLYRQTSINQWCEATVLLKSASTSGIWEGCSSSKGEKSPQPPGESNGHWRWWIELLRGLAICIPGLGNGKPWVLKFKPRIGAGGRGDTLCRLLWLGDSVVEVVCPGDSWARTR